MLTPAGKVTRSIGAVLAGIDFGTCIDEPGKFITATSDSVFQPTRLMTERPPDPVTCSSDWCEWRQIHNAILALFAFDGIQVLPFAIAIT